MVRQLIPDAVPGNTMEDLVLSRVDYDLLDRKSNNTRIRLNSTAVKVGHVAGAAQIGRISIANSDASAYAYVNGAIDAADRAVNEQTGMT